MDTRLDPKTKPNTTNSESKCIKSDEIFNPEYLEAAFEEAKKAIQDKEVPVGCVFVKNVFKPELKNEKMCPSLLMPKKYEQKIISRGRNTVNATKNATRHAEMNCIDEVHYSLIKGV